MKPPIKYTKRYETSRISPPLGAFNAGHRGQAGISDIAKLLRDERVRQNLSQREVAEKMGVPQAHISRLEAGSDGRLSTMTHFARVLGLELMLVPKAMVKVVGGLGHDKAPAAGPLFVATGDDE
jgi:DNA-binding phage protein